MEDEMSRKKTTMLLKHNLPFTYTASRIILNPLLYYPQYFLITNPNFVNPGLKEKRKPHIKNPNQATR